MKDDSIVKSFRVPESMFEQANDIFKKEGFSLSEVIRILFQATIREGRVPRGLSTREMEVKSDAAKTRENYMNSILAKAIPNFDGKTTESKLLDCIFGTEKQASDMSNAALRDWASSWGLPETLSVATLADLYESKLFGQDPWDGAYDDALPDDGNFTPETVVLICKENLKQNLQHVMTELEIKSMKKLLLDYTAHQEDKEYE